MRYSSPLFLAPIVALLILASPVDAAFVAEDEPAAAEKPRPCAGEEHRQFDFWLGQWTVTAQGSDIQAESRISSVADGCAILEEYRNPRGYAGKSLNFFDQAAGRWHQTWIDNQGQPLYLEGGLVEGAMVLSDAAGKNRITWRARPDGTVQQVWEVTEDGGESWKTVFDGIYRRH